MMESGKTDILVYAHWRGMSDPRLMGTLSAHRGKGSSVFSFEYDPGWLMSKQACLIDPDIGLFPGTQFAYDRGIFGVFADSMPDTWGRTLMKRREAQLARGEKRPVRRLHDLDFLLGVADTTRMGGLRLKRDSGGPFLDDDHAQPVPPLTSVRELQRIAGLVEADGPVKELDRWLQVLLAPGSSLGGARPKANLLDHQGRLWIAKFPSLNDTIDKGAWEFLAYRLAGEAGITMAPSRMERVEGAHHTFLTQRFDRHLGKRIHFASAMTMTGYTEEKLRDRRGGYLEIAEFIQNEGCKIDADLAELWRRIVFSIAISNTDDHLRNHGFILEPGGWRLSAAYDVNPSVDKEELALNIDESSGFLDFSLAMQVAPWFRLKPEDAGRILKTVQSAVGSWESMAKRIGIRKAEIDQMRGAFG